MIRATAITSDRVVLYCIYPFL